MDGSFWPPNIHNPKTQLPWGVGAAAAPPKLRVLSDSQTDLGAPSSLSPHLSPALQLHSSPSSSSPWASLFQAFVPLLDGNFPHFSTHNLFMASAYFLFSCQVCLLDLLPPQHFPCPHLFIETNLCLLFFPFFLFFFIFFSPQNPLSSS